MLGSWVRGSPYIDSYGMMMMMMMIPMKGVSEMGYTKINMFDLIKSGMKVNSERGTVINSLNKEEILMKTRKEKGTKYECMLPF
jgi:hypothetical protein